MPGASVNDGGKATRGQVSNLDGQKPQSEADKDADEEEMLIQAVIEDCQRRKDEGITNHELGPVISGAYDTTNGNMEIFLNNPYGSPPSDLHPYLQDRLVNMPDSVKDSYKNSHGAGSHSEIYAVSELLNKNPTAKPSDIIVYSNRTGGSTLPVVERPVPACPHCSYLLEGFRIVSG